MPLNDLLDPRIKRAAAWFATLATLFLAGCQHAYQELPVAGAPERPILRTDSTVYVALPPDGRRKRDFVPASGETMAIIVRDTFAKYVKRAYMGRRVQSFADGLETARTNQWNYFVYPSILRWEDHATDLSGLRDKIEVKIEVADTATGEILHATVLRGRSRWFSDGGDTPKDLLPEPVQNYVSSLFQPVRVPSALR
jgi:hypothetical protein